MTATGLLPAISAARPADWVSVAWSGEREVIGVSTHFVVVARHALPASVAVSYWDGGIWRPVTGAKVAWAVGDGEPTSVTFDPVATTRLRLDLASGAPQAPNGSIAITTLTVDGGLTRG